MLDPHGREEVISTIERLNREMGITVVLITHHMTEAIRAQRVIVMDAGRILADGTPKEVFPQVELLESVGLTVPATTKVLYALNQVGFDLPLDALSTEECAQVLLAAIGAETGQTIWRKDHWPQPSRSETSRIPTAPERRFSTMPLSLIHI